MMKKDGAGEGGREMPKEQGDLCDSFSTALTDLIAVWWQEGMAPMHTANLCLLAAAKIAAEAQGPREVVTGLRRVADEVEAGLASLH